MTTLTEVMETRDGAGLAGLLLKDLLQDDKEEERELRPVTQVAPISCVLVTGTDLGLCSSMRVYSRGTLT